MNAAVASRYTFAAPADFRFDEAWRPLDRAVACWVLAHRGSRELAQVAAWASFAEGRGHSALSMSGSDIAIAMPPLSAGARAIVESDALVSVIQGAASRVQTPFVIEGDYFLLRRNFLHEIAVAEHVAQRRNSAHSVAADARWLDELFQGMDDASVRAQRDAAAAALGRRLLVLTGAPGTGKTTTVLRMLTLLVREWQRRETGSEPVMRASAPTGKAAQRLAQSLREGAETLGIGVSALGAEWQAALAAARSTPASTLHRLLGSRGHDGAFRYDRGNRLPADIVVVDEASMIDLSLLRRLLDALRDNALLVLVGDADQLTSVGTGSVFRDIVRALDASADLVRLQHNFRADQALVPLNEAVREGDAAAFAAACSEAGGRVDLVALSSQKELLRETARWGRELRRHLRECGAFGAVDDAQHALAVLAALRERQLLCALRETAWGAEAVNDMLDRMIRDELGDADGAWYRGRAIMITMNDYSTGLYNGDVGICLSDAAGRLRVWFEAGAASDAPPDSAAARRAVALAIGSLPAHQGAFAITIHKSQGSEYGHVGIVLPDEIENPILSRELLYTGVSRARHSLEIWGREDVIARALARPVQRAGLLEQRLHARAMR